MPECGDGVEPVAVQVNGYAMGSEFALLLLGEERDLLEEAGNAALSAIYAVEAQLSHTLPTSDFSRINACAAQEPVQVAPPLFVLLTEARRLTRETEGAFDLTVGALLHCWGFFRGKGSLPDAAAIAEARRCCGWEHVHLDAERWSVRFDIPGLVLHAGAIGKGYALDQAAQVLRDRGVTMALLHGGGSSVLALGAPPGAPGWGVGLRDPCDGEQRMGIVLLRDAALSTSGAQEQFFIAAGKRYGHILDPRSGKPAAGTLSATALAKSGTASEAFSTAFAVLGVEGARRCCNAHPHIGAILVSEETDPVQPIWLGSRDCACTSSEPTWLWEGQHDD